MKMKIVQDFEIKDLEIKGATLLSVKEANQLPKEIRKICRVWWLRSPGYDDDNAAVVTEDGQVNGFDYCVDQNEYGVRPVLIINCENLKIWDKFLFGDKTFTIVSNTYALCDDIIGRCAFREDCNVEDANVYEASDVKKYVDKWFAQLADNEEAIGGMHEFLFKAQPFGYSLEKLSKILKGIEDYASSREYENVKIFEIWEDFPLRTDIQILYRKNGQEKMQKLLYMKEEIIDGETFHKRFSEFYEINQQIVNSRY